jgi:hypothetical protein
MNECIGVELKVSMIVDLLKHHSCLGQADWSYTQR